MYFYPLSGTYADSTSNSLAMDERSGAVITEVADFKDVSQIILYGVTSTNQSAVLIVHGWKAPFLLNIPDWWDEDSVNTLEDFCTRIHPDTEVETLTAPQSYGWIPNGKDGGKTPQSLHWARIKCASERIRAVTANNIRDNFRDRHPALDERSRKSPYTMPPPGTFCDSLTPGWRVVQDKDSTIMQFMEDTEASFCKWIHVSGEWGTSPDVNAQLYMECGVCEWNSQTDTQEPSVGPPLRILSFDIETFSEEPGFPEINASTSHISDIGICISDSHGGEVIKHSLYCDSPQYEREYGVRYDTEDQLLAAFASYIQEQDIQIITGFNISGYDTPFILKKAKQLNPNHPLLTSMCKYRPIVGGIREFSLDSAQRGELDVTLPNWWAYSFIDCYDHIKNNYRLPSYKLNAVAQKFLHQQQKDEMSYNEMHRHLRHEPGTHDIGMLTAIGKYCVQDAWLPLAILQKVHGIVDKLELAALCRCQPQDILQRGVQIRVYSLFKVFSRKSNVVVCRRTARDTIPPIDAGYEGATVIEPVVGYHRDCNVTCLDYTSMYPSIIRRWNLDYMSYVVPGSPVGPASTVEKWGEHRFIQHYEGVLPRMVREVLDARKAVKRQMKVIDVDTASRDEMTLYNTLDAKQKALKVLANSAYGAAGTPKGINPCMAIAQSTTTIGRWMIENTQRIILENGRWNPRIIYGDTDSVMYANSLPVEKLEEALQEGDRLAAIINQFFGAPINIELEKTMSNMLLLAKKRYAAKYCERGRDQYFYARGLEVARTDYNALVRNTQEKVLKLLVMDGDPEAAKRCAIETTVMLAKSDQLPLDDICMSSSLKRTESLKNPESLAHWQANNKMRLREPGSEFNAGDRIPYVICEGTSDKIASRAEYLEYVREHKIPIDRAYYLDNLIGPLSRVLEPVCGQMGLEALFSHARHALRLKQRGCKSISSITSGEITAPVPKRLKRTVQSKRAVPSVKNLFG